MALLPEIPSPIAPSFQLEWDKFVAFLGGYAQSALGRGWIGALVPSQDRAWVRRTQTLVAEMRLLVSAGIMPQLRLLFDPTDLLAKARIEGVALESEELRAVIALAEEITAWTELMRTPPENTQGRLPALTELSQELLGTILRAADGIDAGEDSAGWDAGGRCFAGAAADSARDGTPAAGH